MPQNHRLQFSVEESICFQKGQEVSELLSISLDPDISVQEVNDYVSIRGSLELTGEYNIDQTREYAELPATSRFVEDVTLKGDGSAELTHCFPVDITIPKNKVSHLNDVFVFIDAFDYQLTDARMLTIQADLAIEGLLDVSGEDEEKKETHPQPVLEEASQYEEEPEPAYRAYSSEEKDADDAAEKPFSINLDSPYEYQEIEEEQADEDDGESDENTVPIYQSFLGESESEVKPFFTASLSAAERTKREQETHKEAPDNEEHVKAELAMKESREGKKAELARKESEEGKKAELVRKESEKGKKAELARKESEEGKKAELAMEESEESKKAELARKESEEGKKAELARKESEEGKKAELARKESEEGNRAEIAMKESEEPEPLYRTYPGHEETKEAPFYGVPHILQDEEEQDEREPQSFEIEVKQEAAEEESEPSHSIEIPEYSFHEQEEPEKERDESGEGDEADGSVKENDNALYLTKLFTKQGEEEFTRMRMCIVQQHDTIDLLCERYGINAQQLIRMNSLSLDEEIKEGQILYIPDYHNSHA
ncbi:MULTISPECIES: LysM peptidoglycan-binding domain-containing protein [Bacillus]|uniref:Stage VI sporulation protein D n=4 Tax=Bacillus sonorensis TaxID=119858 RepID=A0ABN5AHC6_9BACI|nr:MULTISPECIES: LysM peptidoglycan-binding domain-containing protein [Bacillus]ASB88057.1 Stage VI sporulation protein D [Bacillus sonorensis]MBG9915936.1 peptigoglycan-binding protein LysM [Bacillus sonorensis]MDR4959273.1 LysM peptidoglycan-binding domain-containing protein [Bacillus sonorensis]NWN79861.1 LysM peptidoglycan-binding domain-containing protein [Bacillus sp. (in: firmicutes)]WOV59616.1 LysM peptidoglycan-binding domain-containing protein [Bacillus sp. KICET-3]